MVFGDLNVADRTASNLAAKLAGSMLPLCPHLPVRERAMASLCHEHPAKTVACGLRLLVLEQKMSPSCYESMLLALVRMGAVQTGNSLYTCLLLIP